MPETKTANSNQEWYRPSPDVIAQAHIKDWEELARRAEKDYVGFWEDCAREFIDWHAPWTQALDDSNKPFFRWFVGAKTNIVFNAIDRHLKTHRKNKLALFWEGEKGEHRTFSYFSLNREVSKFASVLKALGVKKGDRVTIYMGRVPELAISMLACAKIGAVHSVVYGGFSTESLHGRIEDSQSRVVVTCDGAFLNGKIVELKRIADEAIKRAPIVEHVVVYRRTGHEVPMEEGRDMWWHELMSLPIADPRCPTEILDAEDTLFLLYTSGTTGKPKAIVHTHGGYQVGVATTLKYVFDLRDDDRWWCAADPGWITGHSYIVYGPLVLGATGFMYEGAPTYPYPDRWWQMAEKYGITGFTPRRPPSAAL